MPGVTAAGGWIAEYSMLRVRVRISKPKRVIETWGDNGQSFECWTNKTVPLLKSSDDDE